MRPRLYRSTTNVAYVVALTIGPSCTGRQVLDAAVPRPQVLGPGDGDELAALGPRAATSAHAPQPAVVRAPDNSHAWGADSISGTWRWVTMCQLAG